MKGISFIILFFFIFTKSKAQYEPDTAIKPVNSFFGFYLTSGRIDKDFVLFPGITAGVHINKGIYAGLWGAVKSSENKGSFFPYEDFYIEMMHFGPCIGYEFSTTKTFNPVIFIYAGAGEFSLNNKDGKTQQKDTYYIIKPSIELEAQLVSYFRIAIGLNYQYFTSFEDIQGYKNDMFSGIGANLVMRFGIP